MQDKAKHLCDLAQRVGQGDGAAAGLLVGELEPRLVFIVRRVMRTRAPTSVLAERILSEAGRLTGDHAVENEELIAQVARNISVALVDRLRGGTDGLSALCDTLQLLKPSVTSSPTGFPQISKEY